MKHDESNPTSDYGLKLDESMFFKFVTENVYAVCGHAQSMLTDGEFRCRKFLPSVFSAHLVYYGGAELDSVLHAVNESGQRVIYMFLDSGSNCQMTDDFTCETKVQNLPIGGVHGTFQPSKKRGKFTA